MSHLLEKHGLNRHWHQRHKRGFLQKYMVVHSLYLALYLNRLLLLGRNLPSPGRPSTRTAS